MKRLLILLILLMPINSFALQTGAENALDGGARALGFTLDTRVGSTAPYKYYEANVTSNGVTINVFSDLGRCASAGFFINNSPSYNISIYLSPDGTNYGEEISVKTLEAFDLTIGIIFKKIALQATATANYRLLVR